MEVFTQLLGIEMSLEEFDALMVAQNNGKQLKVIDGKVVAVDYEPTQEEIKLLQIDELKERLIRYKYDIEQVELFDMQRDDYEQKKQMCRDIILQLRELEKQL